MQLIILKKHYKFKNIVIKYNSELTMRNNIVVKFLRVHFLDEGSLF